MDPLCHISAIPMVDFAAWSIRKKKEGGHMTVLSVCPQFSHVGTDMFLTVLTLPVSRPSPQSLMSWSRCRP